MKREERSNEKIKCDIKSAGQSFLGIHIADLLNRTLELDDKELKKVLIQEYYDNQIGTFDKEISGTQTRVNAVSRIIRADKVIYALSMIDGSDSRVLQEAVIKAQDTLLKIKSGQIQLPVLE